MLLINKINKRQVFQALILTLLVSCSGNSWVERLPKPWTLSQDEISKILVQFHKHYPDFQDRLKAFIIWQTGKPYELYSLGEEQEPDQDPIIRLDVSDCTVHVLTSLAFAQSDSWAAAREVMIRIHYKPGPGGEFIPAYLRRWHYTSDRLLNNPYTKNITEELFPLKQLETVDIVLNQKQDGTPFLDLDWENQTVIKYIPNRMITKDLLHRLPPVCGVAFVKKAWFKLGLVIAHEGIIVDNKNIVHASSEFGQTVHSDFINYYYRDSGPLFDGIMLFTFHEIDEGG